jgi:hypothetical protein
MKEEYSPSPEILKAILQNLEDAGDFSPACLGFVKKALQHGVRPENPSYKTPIPAEYLREIRDLSPWHDRVGAAAYLNVDEKTIDRLRKTGDLPTHHPRGRKCPRFLRDDLDALMSEE